MILAIHLVALACLMLQVLVTANKQVSATDGA